MDITFFEIHLPDAEFVAPGGKVTTGAEADDETDTTTADVEAEPGSGSGSGGGAIVALVVLLGLVALGWYLRRERSTGPAAED